MSVKNVLFFFLLQLINSNEITLIICNIMEKERKAIKMKKMLYHEKEEYA